jgi:hypothetical protein
MPHKTRKLLGSGINLPPVLKRRKTLLRRLRNLQDLRYSQEARLQIKQLMEDYSDLDLADLGWRNHKWLTAASL